MFLRPNSTTNAFSYGFSISPCPSVLRTSMAQPTIWNTSALNSNLSSSPGSSRLVSMPTPPKQRLRRLDRVHSWLLFIRRHFRQLRREETFLFFLVQRQTRGRDDARGDEDDQVLFGVLFDVGAKRSANKWNVANDRNFIFCLLHVFAQ